MRHFCFVHQIIIGFVMEKRHEEMWIPRYKGKSAVGDYASAELIKTINHASPLKVQHSFLMLCAGPVTCHLCCSLGLSRKIQNNTAKHSAGLLSLMFSYVEKFLLNLNLGCRPRFLVSISQSLIYCWSSLHGFCGIACSNPVLALLCIQCLQTPALIREGTSRGRFALAGSAVARKSTCHSSIAFQRAGTDGS